MTDDMTVQSLMKKPGHKGIFKGEDHSVERMVASDDELRPIVLDMKRLLDSELSQTA